MPDHPAPLARLARTALIPLLLCVAGCQGAVLDPAGDIALQQRNLIYASVGLMLLIIVPVMMLIILIFDKILARRPQQALIIGGYVDQLKELGAHLDAPVIDGSTSTAKRERLFQQFRDGTLPVLVVSKVANFSIDLPEAALAIQVSGTFGSRQEEAQRLGRLLRPKETEALFYTLVTRDSLDADYAMHRQRFLAEQGYAYRLIDALDLEQ